MVRVVAFAATGGIAVGFVFAAALGGLAVRRRRPARIISCSGLCFVSSARLCGTAILVRILTLAYVSALVLEITLLVLNPIAF